MPFGKSSGPLNALEVLVDGPKIEPIQSILIDGQGAWPISVTNRNIGPSKCYMMNNYENCIMCGNIEKSVCVLESTTLLIFSLITHVNIQCDMIESMMLYQCTCFCTMVWAKLKLHNSTSSYEFYLHTHYK